MLGHYMDGVLVEACERLQESCSYFEWLGSYPQARQSTPNT